MMAGEEVSMNAATVAVLSQPDISSLKDELRITALKAFLNGKDVFVLLLTGFSKSNKCDRQGICPITFPTLFQKNLP